MTQDNLYETLSGLHDVSEGASGVFVHTHCVYPSGVQVRVRVEKLSDGGYRVTDDALGFGEVLSMGLGTKKPGYYIAEQANRYGLKYSRGAIIAMVESRNTLPAAVILVANASKDGVVRTTYMYEIDSKPSFDYLFDNYVKENHKNKFHPGVITGASGKQRKFRYIHQKGNVSDVRINEKIVLVEPVSPGQMSIAMKTQSHRDIVRRKLPNLWQCLVVDLDVDPWTKSDLALLDQADLQWMEFPKVTKELASLVV